MVGVITVSIESVNLLFSNTETFLEPFARSMVAFELGLLRITFATE